MGLKVKFDATDFIKGLSGTKKELKKIIANRMDKAVEELKTRAVDNAPHDSGDLRRSVHASVKIKRKKIVGIVGFNIVYAVYVHQGTGRYASDGKGRKTPWAYEIKSGPKKGVYFTYGQKPNPFLKRALDEKRSDIKRILGGR